MTFRTWCLAALAVLAPGPSAVAEPARRPNVVVFLADDLGWADCSPYGGAEVPTPNMARLARDGMTLTHAFVASPSCAPSRAALLTGLDPMRNEALQALEPRAAAGSIRLRKVTAPGVPPIRADRQRVDQVLTNLIRNGIEAMHATHPAERVLSIDARVNAEDRVEVRVADHGPGVSRADEAQLFTPFFTTKPDGMGMGLAISRSIVEAHGGRLWASANIPQGSKFQFTLPRYSE